MISTYLKKKIIVPVCLIVTIHVFGTQEYASWSLLFHHTLEELTQGGEDEVISTDPINFMSRFFLVMMQNKHIL